MSVNFSRRRILAAGAGTAFGATAAPWLSAGPAGAAASTRPAGSAAGEETRTLDELYRDAVAEGGKLVVYAGGDLQNSGSGAGARTAFRARFPEIDLQLIVDYSKYHDVRIDNQLATNTLVPDVVQLQTLQDFTRWKHEGRLLCYKPAGFGKLHHRFRDRDWSMTFALPMTTTSLSPAAARAWSMAAATPSVTNRNLDASRTLAGGSWVTT